MTIVDPSLPIWRVFGPIQDGSGMTVFVNATNRDEATTKGLTEGLTSVAQERTYRITSEGLRLSDQGERA